MRFITGLVGAVDEAWAELRIHRTRVMLSLIGVGVAVAAITSVVGIGGMVEQSNTEMMERNGGRPAMISISAYNAQTGEQPKGEAMQAAFDGVIDRYTIGHSSAVRGYVAGAQFVDGVAMVDVRGVDASYGTMHRIRVLEGNWFVPRDEERLAPAMVVNTAMMDRLGQPALESHPVLKLVGELAGTGVIVGVVSNEWAEEGPRAFMLNSAFERLATPAALASAPAGYELWVPPEMSDQLVPLIQRDMAGALGEDFEVNAQRQDYLAWGGGGDPMLPLKILVGGVAGLVLLLGALGLVNISLVTVRQRIREIGIRRSFGATAGRVFFSVMMESVVASFAAGVVGVIAAIFIVRMPWVQENLAQGLIDLPPFPVEAALLGLGAATAVGALAGLLPALVAVRVKVIDAIRF